MQCYATPSALVLVPSDVLDDGANSSGRASANALSAPRGERARARATKKGYWMGYAVRNVSWRFVMWLPADSKTGIADWSAPRLLELYNYTVDSLLTSYDDLDVVNLAYHPDYATATRHLEAECTTFFRDVLPPQPRPGPAPQNPECSAAGGLSGAGAGGSVCCALSCGHCGGKGCAKLPGGSRGCCGHTIEGNGKSCKTSKAPCNVEGEVV